MKNLMVALFVVMFAAPSANASKFEVDFQSGQSAPSYQLLLQRGIGHGVGAFGYGCITPGWSEAYAGFSYAPTSWLEIAAGAGSEQYTKQIRLGGWIWAGYDRFSMLYLLENGGTGRWHKLELRTKVTPTFNLGWVDKAFAGHGPFVEFKIDKAITVKASSLGHGQGELALSTAF